MHFTSLTFGRRTALLVTWAILGLWEPVSAARAEGNALSRAQETPLSLRQPLSVGAYTDAYPYSYLDSDGHLTGFDVDLLDAVAKAVNLQIERVTGPANEIRRRFQNGEFEMLQYQAVTAAVSRESADFSVPLLILQGCIYVRTGGSIHELKDLNGQAFGTMGNAGQDERLLADNHIRAHMVHLDSQEELLRSISSGDMAACFTSQLTELSIVRKLHLTNIVMLGRPYNGYEIRQAFSVHRGDAELLARLNEGLAIVHTTGEYDRLYRRSFSPYGSFILSVDDVELFVSMALGAGFVVALWGYFRQRKFRKALSLQASKLAEQGALLQALYNNIPMAMTVIEKGVSGPYVLSMNRQAHLLYSLDSVAAGTPLESLAVLEDIRKHLTEAAGPLPDGGPVTRETVLKNGRRLLEVIAVQLVSPEDAVTARICVLVADVTERRQQEAEVVRSRKLRAVGELVGGIAHEFNNLLTPVMLKAGEIQITRPDDAELQQDIEVIIQAVQRTAELTRRLLTFGRKVEHRPESVRIAVIAAGCFDLLKHTVDRRIQWEHKIPDQLAPLFLNATDLNQILLNLLLNARDALLERLSGRNPANWTPAISVEVAAFEASAFEAPSGHTGKTLLGWQVLSVRDSGLGMSPDVVERIFEPFFTTKDVGKGTGLGLATVWHLVNEAGGRVKVESVLGTGSTFLIYLPVWPSSEKNKAPVVAAPSGRTVRLMLIEDEDLVAKPIVQLLERKGHNVRHFSNGLSAWQHLEGNLSAYDLLIIDVNLPGMNGIDIVARARERDFMGRIFMVSGRFTSADMSALTRLKIDHSLTKPFNVPDFLQAVQQSLGTGHS